MSPLWATAGAVGARVSTKRRCDVAGYCAAFQRSRTTYSAPPPRSSLRPAVKHRRPSSRRYLPGFFFLSRVMCDTSAASAPRPPQSHVRTATRLPELAAEARPAFVGYVRVVEAGTSSREESTVPAPSDVRLLIAS
jgi:hypothetical protein